MFFIGLNSGTSVDAIDAAIVRIENNKLSLETFIEYSIPNKLRNALLAVDEKTALDDVAILNMQLGDLFADAVEYLIKKAAVNANDINTIGLHGQTVLHSPNSNPAYTIQLADANTLVAKTGINVVNDFRGMDIANNGEGAPLAPVFHQFQFNSSKKNKVVLNIGGIANISLLSTQKTLQGFDTGPGNGLMNAWVKQHHNEDYDADGNWAREGKCHQALLSFLLEDDYFKQTPPKSTGREYFNLAWLEKKLNQFEQDIPAVDIQASLLQLTVKTIVNDINTYCDDYEEVIVCGGGAYNKELMQSLDKQLNCELVTSDHYAIDPNAVEACLFAWLAYCRINNIVVDLRTVTGANKACILGAIYSSTS